MPVNETALPEIKFGVFLVSNKKRVLILCTGNSCRSQMAEVLWRELAGDQWDVYSAGSKPAGYVHPLAIQALQESGLNVAGLASKAMEPFIEQPIELVVTVCDHAKASCPLVNGTEQTLHWPFDDPAEATGSEQEKVCEFRRIRDEIKQTIEEFLGRKHNNGPDVASQPTNQSR